MDDGPSDEQRAAKKAYDALAAAEQKQSRARAAKKGQTAARPSFARWLQYITGLAALDALEAMTALGFRQSNTNPARFYRFIAAGGQPAAQTEVLSYLHAGCTMQWKPVRHQPRKARRRPQPQGAQ